MIITVTNILNFNGHEVIFTDFDCMFQNGFNQNRYTKIEGQEVDSTTNWNYSYTIYFIDRVSIKFYKCGIVTHK